MIMEQNTMKYKVKQYLMFAGVSTVLFSAVVILPFIWSYIFHSYKLGRCFKKTNHLLDVKLYCYIPGCSLLAGTWTYLRRYSVIAVIFGKRSSIFSCIPSYQRNQRSELLPRSFFVPSRLVVSHWFMSGNSVFNKCICCTWKISFRRSSFHLLAGYHKRCNGMSDHHICIMAVCFGYMMLICVAGFMSVSKSLMEAAQIWMAAPKTQATINVTIPLMRSSFVQCLFLTITRCFMVYDVNLSLTKGEPFNSSVMAAMHVYNQAFTYKNYGTGQAEALILFVVCAIVGVTQVYIGKKGEVAA